jgi:hypothetical protein
MKTMFTAIAAMALTVTAASAQQFCERVGTRFVEGQFVHSTSLPFYAHGCDRFQHTELSAQQAANLLASGNCSIEASPSGGTEEEEIEVVLDYETTVPGEFSQDNLTSMGAAISNGQQVMRVRSATDGNTVSIRQAGGGVVWSGTVGAGDTFVQVGGPGTYIATTGSRTITKATGPQTFGDVRTETIIVELPESEAFYDLAPRGDRCGSNGELIAAVN